MRVYECVCACGCVSVFAAHVVSDASLNVCAQIHMNVYIYVYVTDNSQLQNTYT